LSNQIIASSGDVTLCKIGNHNGIELSSGSGRTCFEFK
jgi:hypothetical protein